MEMEPFCVVFAIVLVLDCWNWLQPETRSFRYHPDPRDRGEDAAHAQTSTRCISYDFAQPYIQKACEYYVRQTRLETGVSPQLC